MRIDSYAPTIRRKEMDAVLTTMVGERVGPGEQSHRLVSVAKEYLAFDYALALRSPATALALALRGLDLPPGSEVVVSALSPRYYAQVLADLGLVPAYCDVEEASLAMTAETVRAAIGQGTRAVVVHHALGIVPDVPSIVELGLPVVEDCSRSYGTNWGDRKAGSFGVFTVLGLEERDMLTAGGGALLYANARRDASVLRTFADLPFEYRLPDMNASLATIQFKEFERNWEKRKDIAANYIQASARSRHRRPVQGGDAEYNNYTFPLVLEKGMKDAKAYAAKREVETSVAFEDSLVAREPREGQSCPVAASAALRCLLFPLYPRLGKTQVSKVTKVLATLP